jgi:hypothetical protein
MFEKGVRRVACSLILQVKLVRPVYDISNLKLDPRLCTLKKHKRHGSKFVVSVNKQLSLADIELYIRAVGGVVTVPLNWVNIASSHTG